MNQKIIALAVIAILIIILAYFGGCFTPATITLTPTSDTASQGPTKLHESEVGTSSITWNDCCAGFVDATVTFNWDFFITEDVPDDYECDNDVEIIVYDSAGSEAYSNKDNEPTSYSDSFTGYWDCITPWSVRVYNGCIPAITYSYTLTMECP